jgi:hypothetical protein
MDVPAGSVRAHKCLAPTVRSSRSSVSCLSNQTRTIRATVNAGGRASDQTRSTSPLIDGDHIYQVVRQDCELYAPLARPGGRSTTSRSAPAVATFIDCGGLRECHPAASEFVSDPAEKGYGIV